MWVLVSKIPALIQYTICAWGRPSHCPRVNPERPIIASLAGRLFEFSAGTTAFGPSSVCSDILSNTTPTLAVLSHTRANCPRISRHIPCVVPLSTDKRWARWSLPFSLETYRHAWLLPRRRYLQTYCDTGVSVLSPLPSTKASRLGHLRVNP